MEALEIVNLKFSLTSCSMQTQHEKESDEVASRSNHWIEKHRHGSFEDLIAKYREMKNRPSTMDEVRQ